MPRSILVLPSVNESAEVDAPCPYPSTVSQTVAERGFYVFPVSVVDACMKDNGLPTAGEMHGVTLSKIDEIIGADAVLYITIVDRGQKYWGLNSRTVVSVKARLVDVTSGATRWTSDATVTRDATDADSNLAEMLVGAVVAVPALTELGVHPPLCGRCDTPPSDSNLEPWGRRIGIAA